MRRVEQHKQVNKEQSALNDRGCSSFSIGNQYAPG